MTEKWLEFSRQIQNKEDELQDLVKEEAKVMEVIADFSASLRWTQQGLGENHAKSNLKDDYENSKIFNDDMAFFGQISSDLYTAEAEIENDYRVKKNQFMEEIENLYVSKAKEDSNYSAPKRQ